MSPPIDLFHLVVVCYCCNVTFVISQLIFSNKRMISKCCVRCYSSGLHQRLVDRWKYMANLLGVDEECARRMLYQNDTLKRLDEARIEKTFDTLTEIGMSVPHIVQHPQILSYYPGYIDARYWSLTDFGLEPVKIPEILGYNSLIKKRAYELRRLELLADNVEPFGHLLSKLTDLDTRFVNRHPDVENRSLLYMKKLVLLEFLSQKLKCSRTEVVALVNKYPVIANRSVCSIRRSLHVLQDRFGFSTDKVKANGFLLMTHSCNAKRIADELSDTIGCEHVREFVVKYPKTLTVPISRFLANNDCLTRFEITPEQILKGGAVYTLNTDTLRERLDELDSTKAFRAIKSSPRALSIVYSMNTAKKRLSHLESLGFPNPSLNALSSGSLDFDHLLSASADRCSSKAALSQLAAYVGRSEREVSESLAVRPSRRGLSVENVSQVLSFLEKRGFTTEQIRNGLQVVLYRLDVVESYVGAVAEMEECRSFGHEEWERHPFALQLLLYVIEKNHHQVHEAEKHSDEMTELEGRGGEEVDARRRCSPKLPELKYGYGRCVVTSSDDEVESFLVSKNDEDRTPSI